MYTGNLIVCIDKGCPDGYGSGLPFRDLHPLYVELSHPLFKKQEKLFLEHASQDKILIFADWTPHPKLTTKYARHFGKVYLYDHHFTASVDYKDYDCPPNVHPCFLLDRCGARIIDEQCLWAPTNKLSKRLLLHIDMADRLLVNTPNYGPIVSFFDNYIGSANRVEAFALMEDYEKISDKEILFLGSTLYKKNLDNAHDVFHSPKHECTPVNLSTIGPRWISILHANIRGPGGRFISGEACKRAAQDPTGIVLIWSFRDNLIHISVRTDDRQNAGMVARLFGSYGNLGSGGGSPTIGCFQLWPEEFNYLFPRRPHSNTVKPGLDVRNHEIIKINPEKVDPADVRVHFPEQRSHPVALQL